MSEVNLVDTLLSISFHIGDVILYSAFIAPVFFLGMKHFKLSISSFIAVLFSLSMLKIYQPNLDLSATETILFVVFAHTLNICAIGLGLVKLLSEKQVAVFRDKEPIEEPIEVPTNNPKSYEQKEYKELIELLKEKGISEDEDELKEKRA